MREYNRYSPDVSLRIMQPFRIKRSARARAPVQLTPQVPDVRPEAHNERMRNINLTFPELAFIVGTRAALGVGIGLLVSDRIEPARRRAIGMTLAAVGAATTVPSLMAVLRDKGRADVVRLEESAAHSG